MTVGRMDGMSVLCRIGVHRYRWIFVGSDWQPNDYVRACSRCGQEPTR